MCWVIIGLVITVIVVIYMICADYYFWGEIVGAGVAVFIASMLCALMLGLLSSAIADDCANKTYSVAEDVEIAMGL